MERIREVVEAYIKSKIQSEAEVRSKLIVPLLEALNYPSWLRAEEFPVYSFESGEKRKAKSADFLLFSSDEFADYRTYSASNLDWVKQHSLLVVEAKKPREMPEILVQPEFYTVWTRSVAYLVTDGERIKGYYYNNINSDARIIDCKIDELPDHDEIMAFSFEEIKRVKEKSCCWTDPVRMINTDKGIDDLTTSCEVLGEVTEDELCNLPEHTFQYMRNALGRNADGLSRLQLISRFLNFSDSVLQNDMRYNIPAYTFDMPRREYKANLHLNDTVLPYMHGSITHFYWEDLDRYLFDSKYICIDMITKNNTLCNFEMGFRILDKSVIERLHGFDMVEKVLFAKSLQITFKDDTQRLLKLHPHEPKGMWSSRERIVSLFGFWRKGMEQLKEIEDYYEIEFSLPYIPEGEEQREMLQSIYDVYCGISLQENCRIILNGGLAEENVNIDVPLLVQDEGVIPLRPKEILGMIFIPEKSWLLPGTIALKDTNKDDRIDVPGCCTYKLEAGSN